MENKTDITKNELLDAALTAEMWGFSVIPIGRDKKPLIEWKKYQKERATPDQIKMWWLHYPDANIGAVTGAVSGIVVIDIEKGGDKSGFPETITSQTGGGGFHLFYKHPGVPIKNSVRDLAPLTDVRGDGGYVVLPPSLHASGNRYQWLVSPEKGAFAELPPSLLKKLKFSVEKSVRQDFAATDVPQGKRNDAATQYIGKILHDLSPELWETAGWDGLMAWNEKNCKPPLDEKELRSVFDSIKNNEAGQREQKGSGGGKVNKADQLVEFICGDPSITLFHDELNVAYAKFDVGDHKEILSVNGGAFKQWAAKSYYDIYHKTVSPNVLATALNTVAGLARYDGEEIRLHNRAAMIEGVVWYDLADKKWQAVKITKEGWQIIDNPPTIFKRQQHQEAQVAPVAPVKGGDIRSLLRFVNITDENQQMLFLVLLASYFIPGFPHPLCYVYGSQGSAKSTISKILRRLVDPSRIEVLSFPKKDEELIQVLSHHYLLFFDNVGHISDSVGDLLCRAVTGSGFSKRQLYTDDDDIIYTIKANVGVNGINLTSNKPDLLERSMLFELRRIEKADRKEERKLLEEFERELPVLLGAIFDVISKALAIRPSVRVESLPRMADFALWGCAIAEAMGYPQDAFINAYRKSIDLQNDEVLAEHIEAGLIRSFMDDQEEWSGSASELLEHLRRLAGAASINENELPKSANALSRKLNTLKTNLEEIGIKVTKTKGVKRTITIRRVPANTAETVPSPEDKVDVAPTGGDTEKLPPL